MATRTRRTTSRNGHTRRRAAEPSANGASAPAVSPRSDGGDRDAATGRFVAGNRAAVGNVFARRVAALKSALLDVIDPDRLRRIVAGLADKAETGDVAAAHLLFRYCLGKPPREIDPDRVDSDEVDSLLCSPDLADLPALMAIRIAPAVAADIARGHTCPDTAAIARRLEEARVLAEVGDDDEDDEDEDDAGDDEAADHD